MKKLNRTKKCPSKELEIFMEQTYFHKENSTTYKVHEVEIEHKKIEMHLQITWFMYTKVKERKDYGNVENRICNTNERNRNYGDLKKKK